MDLGSLSGGRLNVVEGLEIVDVMCCTGVLCVGGLRDIVLSDQKKSTLPCTGDERP